MRWDFYWLLIGAAHHTHNWTVAGLMVMTHGRLDDNNKPIWVSVARRCLSILGNVFSQVLMISKGKHVTTLLALPPCGPRTSTHSADSK